ncbi:hypothetical protein [Pantoea piersonii]|uniref:hypothetical protein n=1 Tax=Pantoea TaxID=53335 RepID=UPI0028ADDB02|nr:hypothetical protein [Pantoea piersonii]
MQFIYKHPSHSSLLPQDISAHIEACEMALYLAISKGVNPATIQNLEKQLDYWQQVQFHYW